MRILVVEDEIHLAEALSHILKKNNYTVDVVNNGSDGLDFALSDIYDLILLDIMLPGMDGISILRKIRTEGIFVPVLLLTAKGEICDKVTGLDSGADDYLAKPFASEELLARIRAMTRRKGEFIIEDSTISFGDIKLNTNALNLSRGKRKLEITLRESQLLEFLIQRKGILTSKERIIEKLWGYDSDAEHNHVEVYISFLRKKLNFLSSKVTIKTVRGAGYVLECQS